MDIRKRTRHKRLGVETRKTPTNYEGQNQPRSQGLSSYRPRRAVRWETLGTRLGQNCFRILFWQFIRLLWNWAFIRTEKGRCVLLLLFVYVFMVILTFIPKGNSSNPVIPILLAGLLWSRHSGVRYPTGWTIKWRFNPAFSSASFMAFIVFKHTSGSKKQLMPTMSAPANKQPAVGLP